MSYLTEKEFESLAASVDAGIERYLQAGDEQRAGMQRPLIEWIELAEVAPKLAAKIGVLAGALLQASPEQRPAMMARLKRMLLQVRVLVLEHLIDALIGQDRDARRQAREVLVCFGPGALPFLRGGLGRSRRWPEQVVLIDTIAAIGATLPPSKLQGDEMIWRLILPEGRNSCYFRVRAKRAREALEEAHALLRAAARRSETTKA
jgi:hypothetical protein